MSKQTIVIANLPTTTPDHFVEVDVHYDKGGMTYFSGTSVRRGYYVAVQPVERKDGWRKFSAFSGTSLLIEEAKRFSQKRLEELALIGLKLPQYQTVLNHVLAKNPAVVLVVKV